MVRISTIMAGTAIAAPAVVLALGAAPGHAGTRGHDAAAVTGVRPVAQSRTAPEARSRTAPAAINRSTVLGRARWWLNRSNIPYSQNTCYTTGGVRTSCRPGTFRADCSGYVSLAWNVGNLTVGSSNPALTPLGHHRSVSGEIRKADLRPGDALAYYQGPGDDAHIALFVRWQGAVGGSAVVWEQAGGQPGPRQHVWSAARQRTYRAFRLSGIREG
jgi:hypothetical protein